MAWRAGIERVDWEWSGRAITDEDHLHDDARYGEQLEWGYAVPMVHRALAAPHVPARMLRLSSSTAVPYWSSLVHLSIYSFGWSRADLGLAHWYFSGRPDTDVDDRLALIDAVWVDDGRFEEILALMLRTGLSGYDGLSHHLEEVRRIGATGTTGPLAPHTFVRREPPADFVSGVERRVAERGDLERDILTGGSDPLHLSAHRAGPLRRTDLDRSVRERMVVDGSTGRAVLHLDGMLGWYRALAQLGSELPDRGERSWKVDVHVATVGHLGTFRRSRDTGLWFSGRHRYHLWGAG